MTRTKNKSQKKAITNKAKTLKPLTLASVIVVSVLALIGISPVVTRCHQPKKHESAPTIRTDDAARVTQADPLASDDNVFVYASADQVLQTFQSGTGTVFLGFPQCPWCQRLVEYVDNAAKAEGIKKVYYLNIREARAANDDNYKKLVKYLKDYLNTDDEGNPRISVPDVTMLKDGKIVGRFEQEKANDANTPDKYWTSERAERATTQLREMMQKTK